MTATLTIRLNPELRARLESVRDRMPYKPTITDITERGISLALDELERMISAVYNSGGKRGEP
jgi:predicted transcriptional regulator